VVKRLLFMQYSLFPSTQFLNPILITTKHRLFSCIKNARIQKLKFDYTMNHYSNKIQFIQISKETYKQLFFFILV